MSIKIYNVVGIGLLVGEKIEQSAQTVFLKYPGTLFLNRQTNKGPQDVIVPPIPEVFVGWNEMMTRFELDKANILFSGKPINHVINLYMQYSELIKAKTTGEKKKIDIADASALNRLPKNGRGGTNNPMNSLEVLNAKIFDALDEFYKDKPYRHILFAFELDNPNGFAFTSAGPQELNELISALRRFADKIERNEMIPMPPEGIGTMQ